MITPLLNETPLTGFAKENQNPISENGQQELTSSITGRISRLPPTVSSFETQTSSKSSSFRQRTRTKRNETPPCSTKARTRASMFPRCHGPEKFVTCSYNGQSAFRQRDGVQLSRLWFPTISLPHLTGLLIQVSILMTHLEYCCVVLVSRCWLWRCIYQAGAISHVIRHSDGFHCLPMEFRS